MTAFYIPFGVAESVFPFRVIDETYDWGDETQSDGHSLVIEGILSRLTLTNNLPLYYDHETNQWLTTATDTAWAIEVLGTGILGDSEMGDYFDPSQFLTTLNNPVSFLNGDATAANTLTIQDWGHVQGRDAAVLATANTTITNYGYINSDGFGIVYGSEVLASHLLQLTQYSQSDMFTQNGIVPSTAVTTNLGFGETITIKNLNSGFSSGSNIIGAAAGIINATSSTLVVVNQGTIGAEQSSYFAELPEQSVLPQFTPSGAIISMGSLSLENTGVIYGGVKLGWHSNQIVNSNEMSGVVLARLMTNDLGIVDTNADGDFTDAGDRAAHRLVGTSISNTGYMFGNYFSYQGVSGNYVIIMDDAKDSLTNSGSIGNGVINGNILMGGGADVIKNLQGGRINADTIDMGDGNDTIINDRESIIYGGIFGGEGSDVIMNDGYWGHHDTSYMGDGNDVVTNGSEGAINGAMDMGLGNDTFTNSGYAQFNTATGFSTQDGHDKIINKADATFYAFSVDMGNGHDTFENDGTVYFDSWLYMGSGNDKVINLGSGDLAAYELRMGSGNNVIENSGILNMSNGIYFGDENDQLINSVAGNISTYALYLYNGNNYLFNGGSLTSTFGVIMGIGNDRLVNESTGTINGGVDMDLGNDSITNSGTIVGGTTYVPSLDQTIQAAIFMRDGRDSLTNTATGVITGYVELGEGHDTLTNNGVMSNPGEDTSSGFSHMTINAGGGNDLFTNGEGGRIGDAFYNEGDVTITNPLDYLVQPSYEFIDNSLAFSARTIVDMGLGNDRVSNTGQIFGAVDMGAGQDSFYGGSGTDIVIDADGRDTYELGGGADVFIFRGEDYDRDVVAGGAGIDVIFFEDPFANITAESGYIINLTSGVVRSTLGGSVNNTISGFEQVVGTSFDDVIIGSLADETLIGGAGDDTIIGRMGQDLLVGGYGSDVFVFNGPNSSPATENRDGILDFDSYNADMLSLAFDTNLVEQGDQFGLYSWEDIFALAVEGFAGAGSCRFDHDAPSGFTGGMVENHVSTVVEWDFDGDMVADFSIAFFTYVY